MAKHWKLFSFLFFILAGVIAKYILFDYPVSTGKRVGNLTKISLKGKFIKTWEGTIDEGSGDKLTTYFSVRDPGLAQKLYDFEGQEVVLYYEEYLVGWPRDTKYNIVSWKSRGESTEHSAGAAVEEVLGKTLFCSFLGTLINNPELYQEVKNYMESNNYYIYKQYEKCNQ